MRWFIFITLAVLLLAGCNPGMAPTATPTPVEPTEEPAGTPTRAASNLSDEEIVERVGPATVLILAQFAETAISPEGVGGGSGIVYDMENGFIVTNAHVVEGASIIRVTTAGSSRTRPARVVGRSLCDDLAVLKVDNTSGLAEAKLGDSNALRPGAHVVALGYPEVFQLGTDLTVTSGNVSKLHAQQFQYEDLIQTNADITHGNSGGPLVNTRGEVIGINTLGFYSARGEREPGINFAIPISYAKPIIEELEKGKNRHYIGLNLYPNVFEDYFGTSEGMAVIGVASGSPASQIGIRPADLLFKLEGTSITTEEDVCNILRSHADGDQLRVTVFRKETGEILEGELTIGKTGSAGPDVAGLKVISKTAEAEPSPTPAADPDAESGDWTIVHQADFDNNDAGGWPTDAVEGATASVANGAYTISISKEGWAYYVSPDVSGIEMADAVVAAEALAEGDGWIGVIGRYTNTTEGNTLYYCWISNAREYGCYKIVNDDWEQIVARDTSSAIQPNKPNRLSMAIIGSQLAFVVNDELLASTSDSDPLPKGAWGIAANTLEGQTAFNAHYNEIVIARQK
jgi:serine protease Do